MNIQINKKTHSPLYLQIVSQLRDAIINHEIDPATQLLSQRDMAKKLNVSRGTIRRAFAKLAEYNLIDPPKGKNSPPPKIQQSVARMMSFFSDMRERNMNPESQLISVREADPPGEVFAFLESSNDPIIRIERIFKANDVPYIHQIKYLKCNLCEKLQEIGHLKSENDLKFMDECVKCWKSADLSIDLEILKDGRYEQYGFEKGSAVFLVKWRVRTRRNYPLSFSYSRFRSDLYTFKFQLSNYFYQEH
ncbi:MAG: GntR family transcriptional regulator [Desulfonatronovibrionaceae bacterium]